MADNKTVYTFEGDASDLITAISQLQTALGGLAKQAKKTDKAVDSVSDSGKKIPPALAPISSSADKVKGALVGLEKASQAVGGKTDTMVNKLSAFARVVPMLANPVGIAAVAIVGLTASVVAVGGAMIGAVFAADELAEELKKFENIEGFEPIAPDAMKSIKAVNDSLGALTAIFQRLVVEVGANVAPAIEEVSVLLVKFGLMGLDAFKQFAKGKDLLFEFANYLVKGFVKALISPIDALMDLVWVLGQIATAVGADGVGKALLGASKAYEGFVDGISRSITGGIMSAVSGGLSSMGVATSDYDARARALIATVGKTDEALKEHKNAVKDLLDVWEKLVVTAEANFNALEKITEAQYDTLSATEKTRKAYSDTQKELDALEKSTKAHLLTVNAEIEAGERLGLSYKQLLTLHGARVSSNQTLTSIEEQRLAAAAKLTRELIRAAESEQELNAAIAGGETAREGMVEGLKEEIEHLQVAMTQERLRNGVTSEYNDLIERQAELERLLIDVGLDKIDAETEASKKRVELREQEADKRTAAEKDIFDARQKNMADISAVSKAYGEAFGSVIDYVMSRNEELSKSQKKNLMVLFRLQQAANLVSIVMDTAGAIVRALWELGPIAGPIAGVAIGVTGAMQAATVATAAPPFHTGGIIPPSMIQGVNISALPGESVLTREATAALGEDGVNDLNSGVRGSNSVIEVQMVYKHKIFDTFVSDNIAKGGPLNDAITGSTRVGRSGDLAT